MLSIPGFWLALILILIFSEQLRWLPTSGTGSLKYFLLPAFVLAFATMATVCRFMRGALLTEFGRQYFLVAKVRGINKFNLLTPAISSASTASSSVTGRRCAISAAMSRPVI